MSQLSASVMALLRELDPALLDLRGRRVYDRTVQAVNAERRAVKRQRRQRPERERQVRRALELANVWRP